LHDNAFLLVMCSTITMLIAGSTSVPRDDDRMPRTPRERETGKRGAHSENYVRVSPTGRPERSGQVRPRGRPEVSRPAAGRPVGPDSWPSLRYRDHDERSDERDLKTTGTRYSPEFAHMQDPFSEPCLFVDEKMVTSACARPSPSLSVLARTHRVHPTVRCFIHYAPVSAGKPTNHS